MAKLSAKHADEQSRLLGEQHNARVELAKRQRKELEEAAAAGAPIVPVIQAPPAAPKRKR